MQNFQDRESAGKKKDSFRSGQPDVEEAAQKVCS